MSNVDLSSHSKRLKRRTRIISRILSRLTSIRVLLFVVGFGWLLLLPWNGLSRRAWIDENALQPGQVTLDWNWGDVKFSDVKLDLIEALWARNATSAERAEFIMNEMRDVGLDAGMQDYVFSTPLKNITGTNAYAIHRSPRTSGTEAMVIVASWVSLQNDGANRQPNLRGVATVLALARSLRRQPVWAKDLIFLVSDSYLDGAHAWLTSYHGATQNGLWAQPLLDPQPTGVIWTALVIDYPGHSFSHLGLFFEGTNGRLPNQDLCNSASLISRGMGVPMVLHDDKDEYFYNVPKWLADGARTFGVDVHDYVRRARNIRRYLSYQTVGEPSGVHGLFHRYRIDAISLYALPARGPHGFHAIGRVVESLLRTTNNLLERLHASFFFYLFTAPGEFAEFARYLPPVIILGLAASFGGLALYVETGWIRQASATTTKLSGKGEIPEDQSSDTRIGWKMRDRPVLEVLCIMGATHAAGLATLAIVSRSWFWAAIERKDLLAAIDLFSIPSLGLLFAIWLYSHILYPSTPEDAKVQEIKASKIKIKGDGPVTTPLTPLFSLPVLPSLPPTTPALLKALSLCTLGAIISVTAVANFSLSVTMAVLGALPLCLVPVSLHHPSETPKEWSMLLKRLIVGAWVTAITPMGLLGIAEMVNRHFGTDNTAVLDWIGRMLWEFSVVKTWFVPLVCSLYLPLTLQGLIVCLLPV